MKLRLLICCLSLALALTACNEDDTVISEVTGVVFQGTAANGFEQCGWLIEINGIAYLPNVLNSQFQEENLTVSLKVEFLGEISSCSTGATAPERIRIEQIKRVN